MKNMEVVEYGRKLKDLEKENETKRWNWLKEKSSYTSNLERENKSLKDSQKVLSEDNTALRLEIGLLKENVGDYKTLKDELKLAKNCLNHFPMSELICIISMMKSILGNTLSIIKVVWE